MPIAARAASAWPFEFLSPWRDHRLRGPQDFAAVLSAGQAVNGRYLRICYLALAPGPARLGMAVSKRYAGTGVQYNRVRRRIREQFRLHNERLADLAVAVELRASCRTQAEARAAAIECGELLQRVAQLSGR